MSDLTKLLGGKFSPPTERRIDPPEVQLRDAMIDAGITPPDDVYLDGKIHRFRSGTNGKASGDKTGWYVAFGDNVPAGRFGCWRAGIEATWVADVGRDLTTAEKMAHTRRMADARAAREAEQKRSQEVASSVVDAIWSEAGTASSGHPYLSRKGINAHGARVTGDGRLIVPLYDQHGELSSLQYIDSEGGKRYHQGGAVQGRFWSIGASDQPGPVYLAEGFATAASIHEVTGRPCFIAYSASNLVPVAEILSKDYADLIVVADNDESGTGRNYADQCAAKFGCTVIIPPIQGDANDYLQAGHDLAALLKPVQDEWLVSADDFSQQPAPISWLIKNHIQRDALIMVHGPSGGGKTFVVLDMCLRMAAGITDWCGHRVAPATVVYLAGEGHHGLRGRIAGWKHQHGVNGLDMWLSRSGLDLNTAEGYQRTVKALRSLRSRPELIVIDTLHRFLSGDENSAQDAKTMLDACAELQREFCCSVLLVHHTGVSDEAQHRARGSSAWRGALDIEISIVPAKNDNPMEVVQRKSKDAELAAPVYGELQSVSIPGWIDEDGDQVTSAVFIQCEPPEKKGAGDSKHTKHIKMLEAAWWHSGAEDRSGKPYITRSGFIDYLTSSLGLKDTSAKVYVKPSQQGKPISDLLIGGVIESFEHGWTVVDQVLASAWMMRKGV